MTEPVEPTEPPAPLLVPDDLKNFATIATAKAQEMIDDALAEAAFHAPCLLSPDFPAHLRAFAKGKIRAAVLRWNEAGSGAVTTQSSMSYAQTVDNRQPRKGMFYPSEIDQLKQLCRPADDEGGAFSIDTLPPAAVRHSPVCDLMMGGDHCTCGANLTGALGVPLWETHPDDGWA